jgi:hypothetical protein
MNKMAGFEPSPQVRPLHSTASSGGEESCHDGRNNSVPLAQSLLNAVSDLLFCPEFTVAPNKKSNRDEVDDLQVSPVFYAKQLNPFFVPDNAVTI